MGKQPWKHTVRQEDCPNLEKKKNAGLHILETMEAGVNPTDELRGHLFGRGQGQGRSGERENKGLSSSLAALKKRPPRCLTNVNQRTS